MRHNLFVPNKMPYAKEKTAQMYRVFCVQSSKKMKKSNGLRYIELNALRFR